MKWSIIQESSEEQLAQKIRNIITTYYDLDDEGNPTIPTEDDLGIDSCEFATDAIDRIWELVK